MDTFYNHLSAFSADSTPHHSSDVGNPKEMARLLSSQETSIKWVRGRQQSNISRGIRQ